MNGLILDIVHIVEPCGIEGRRIAVMRRVCCGGEKNTRHGREKCRSQEHRYSCQFQSWKPLRMNVDEWTVRDEPREKHGALNNSQLTLISLSSPLVMAAFESIFG